MTIIRFEYPCGEYQGGWFNVNGTTIATGTLIETRGDKAVIEFGSAPHPTGLKSGQKVIIPLSEVQLTDALVDAVVFALFNSCLCPNCGIRLKSQNQVRQAERNECCVYVCTRCDETVQEPNPGEIPF